MLVLLKNYKKTSGCRIDKIWTFIAKLVGITVFGDLKSFI